MVLRSNSVLCLFSSERILRNLKKTRLQIDKLSSGTPVAHCQSYRLATIETEVHHSRLVGRIPDETLLPHQPLVRFALL